MQIYNRETKAYDIEKEYGKETLEFLYHTFLGRVLLKLVFARPWFSRLQAIWQRSKGSKRKIQPFIDEYGVDVKAWDINKFKSFNDFFTREKEYSSIALEDELIAIADSKLSVHPIDDELTLNIKNTTYSVDEILNDIELAKYYRNGTCLIFRLSLDDYHRYVYIDDGTLAYHYKIKGELHTIRSISGKYKVYSRNCREVTVLKTRHFGTVTQIEVGAMLVGKINNRDDLEFTRLQEKGYFEYGGSTIVVLLKSDVRIDEDIILQSQNQIETQVHIGERIGKREIEK